MFFVLKITAGFALCILVQMVKIAKPIPCDTYCYDIYLLDFAPLAVPDGADAVLAGSLSLGPFANVESGISNDSAFIDGEVGVESLL